MRLIGTVIASAIIGIAVGIGLGRFARPLALLLALASIAPMAILYIQETYFPSPGESNFGILAVIILIALAPAALTIFIGSWFQD